MSLIAKRRTKRLTEPYRLLTQASPSAVLDAVEATVASFAPRTGILTKHSQFYAFDRTATGCGIAYGRPSDKHEAGRAHFWTGTIEVAATAESTFMVSVRLVGWRTYNDDLLNRKEFVLLRQSLVERWAELDPSLKPLDEDEA